MSGRATTGALLLDAVGTLLVPHPSVAVVYSEAGQRHGSRRSIEVVNSRFRAAFQVEEDRDRTQLELRTDDERELERWRNIVASVFDDLPDSQPVFAELWAHFARPASWRLAEDVVQLLTELARREIVWGIASNFDSRLRTICHGLPALAGCRWVFVSSEVGWRKPSLEFFRTIEHRLGLPPEQIMLVGDDLDNDYRAARSAAWQAVWLNNDHEPGTAAPHIRRLSQLMSLWPDG